MIPHGFLQLVQRVPIVRLHAHVVHQDVDPAMLSVDPLNKRSDSSRVRHIASPEVNVSVAERSGRVLINVCAPDMRA